MTWYERFLMLAPEPMFVRKFWLMSSSRSQLAEVSESNSNRRPPLRKRVEALTLGRLAGLGSGVMAHAVLMASFTLRCRTLKYSSHYLLPKKLQLYPKPKKQVF